MPRLARVSIVVSLVVGMFLAAAGVISLGDQSHAGAVAEIRLTHGKLRDGLARVTAEITPPGAPEPHIVHLQMYDGEAVTVALPGQPEIRYHFRRDGGTVTARIDG